MRLKSLIILCILIFLASPARARITLGMISGANSMTRSEALAGRFASYLENKLGEPVKIRLFADETILHQWLNRYREVDVAFLSEDYFRQQRDGEFFHLADPTPADKFGPMVSRQGAEPLLNQRLRDVLLVMDADPVAEDLLRGMGIRGFTQPGRRTFAAEKEGPRQNSLRPDMQILSRPESAAVKAPRILAQEFLFPEVAPAKAVPAKVVPAKIAPAKVVPAKVVPAKVVPAKVVPAKVAPAKIAPAKVAPAKIAPAKIAPARIAPAKIAPAKVAPARIAPSKVVPGRIVPSMAAKESDPPAVVTAGAELGGPPLTVLAAVAAVAFSGLYGLVLIRRRRDCCPKMIINTTRPANKSKRMPAVATEESRSLPEQKKPVLDTSILHIYETPPAMAPPMEPPPMEPPPMEPPPMEPPPMEPPPMEPPPMEPPPMEPPQTELPPLELPPLEFPPLEPPPKVDDSAEQKNQGGSSFAPLLRSIASGALTGTLLAASRHGEKRILFRSGLISSASSSRGKDKKDILVDKIAHLLVRQGKMSSEKRAEALTLGAGREEGHLGHTLVGMGVIDESYLRQAMREQAEDLISSLLLFPEGEFTFTRQELPPPGEEELALGIDFLLRAASESEEEWDRIRRNLHCAENVLAHTDKGKDLLGKARLTAPQQRVLAMVDGRKTVAEISSSAPMLDLEVYKFLSSMTQASILKVTASISSETC